MDGFQIFRRDCKGRNSGGVAIYARDEMPATEFCMPSLPQDVELLWVAVTTKDGTVFVGALYHPPKPIYLTSSLLDCLEASIECLTQANDKALILLGGNFNSLDISEVSARTVLLSLVTEPTSGENMLDMLMTSRPGLYKLMVITSPIRSDYKAIVATRALLILAFAGIADTDIVDIFLPDTGTDIPDNRYFLD